MSDTPPTTIPDPQPIQPWRVWFPAILVPLMLAARFVPNMIEDAPANIWVVSAFGPFFLSLAVVVWLVLLSRAQRWERVVGALSIVLILGIVLVSSHPSVMGPVFIGTTIPMTIGGLALGAALFGRMLSPNRLWYSLAIAALLGAFSVLIKTDGLWGDFSLDLDWRWKQTAEDRLLADRNRAKAPAASVIDEEGAKTLSNPEWSGLRGPRFDSAQHGLRFSDDWKASPPKELWRIAVGPAWSSFSVAGSFLFTQEQRGESEIVACYDANTGKEVWTHAEQGRFFESLGGLGPRATPTIDNGAVFALGADGKLVVLDAKNGNAVWKVNLGEVAKIKPPMWGFSSSPLVHQGNVIVHAGNEAATEGHLFAFEQSTGDLAWSTPAGKFSYASPQILKVLGVEYLAILSELGLHLYEPDTGKVVLDYAWKHNGYRALQPQVVDSDKILIPTGAGSGTRLVRATMKGDKLQLDEVWTSLDMKPDFNDIVVHKGHVYGFDNTIFACINLENGKRTWKGGRYEKGQAFLLADSELIIVIGERGELVLLRASPEKLQELAKIPAIHGKTWNHPVVVGNRLYIRNAEEAVCYELATIGPVEEQKPDLEE